MTKNKQQAKKKPRKLHRFKMGTEVYLVAYLKVDRTKFYVCKAVVEKVPAENERQVYRVRIIAVADRPVGGEYVVKQASLLGKTITKRHNELNYDIPPFMRPPSWIERDDAKTVPVRQDQETKKATADGQTQRKGQKTSSSV